MRLNSTIAFFSNVTITPTQSALTSGMLVSFKWHSRWSVLGVWVWALSLTIGVVIVLEKSLVMHCKQNTSGPLLLSRSHHPNSLRQSLQNLMSHCLPLPWHLTRSALMIPSLGGLSQKQIWEQSRSVWGGHGTQTSSEGVSDWSEHGLQWSGRGGPVGDNGTRCALACSSTLTMVVSSARL